MPSNPYVTTPDFEESQEQEDIIRVTMRPLEAEFDETSEERIELKEQDPESNRFHDTGPEQKFVADVDSRTISSEDILREAQSFGEEDPLP